MGGDCGCNCRSRNGAALLLHQSAVVCGLKSRNGRRHHDNVNSSPKTQKPDGCVKAAAFDLPSQRILTDDPSTWGGGGLHPRLSWKRLYFQQRGEKLIN